MNNWEIFEIKSFEYLNKNFSNKNLFFRRVGGSDSTLSDIEVIRNNKTKFFIESKMSGAQCGQFVLLDNKKKFIYSQRNKTLENNYSTQIIEYINKNYTKFKSVSTKPILIDIDHKISANWIISHYMWKNVKFIITGYDLKNFIIFPLNKFNKYFNVTANFRIKKSGSRNLSKIHAEKVQSIINGLYKSSNIYYEGKKAFIKIYGKIHNKTTFNGELYTYYLINNKDNIYQIRMLSNTFNANVIFSCNLKRKQDINDLLIFKRECEIIDS